MKRPIQFLILILYTMLAEAQTLQIDWSATQLPVANGQNNQYGLAGASSGAIGDYVLVMGGANFGNKMPWEGGEKKYYDDIYILNFAKSSWTYKTFKLPKNLAYAATVSTPKGIVCIGGENEAGLSKEVLLINFDPVAQKIITSRLPDLPVEFTNASATVFSNKIYVAGGEISTGTNNLFLSFDMNKPQAVWQSLTALAQPTSHAVLVSNGKCVYLAGGRTKTESGISDFYDTLYEFKVSKGTWSKKTKLPYSICAGTGILVDSKNILLFGGDKGETFHKVETLLAEISRETDPVKKQALVDKKNEIQSSHPGFSNEVLDYTIKSDCWNTINKIPFPTPVTTSIVQWQNNIIIPSGEIRAGVRTLNVLVGKLNQIN